jgi:hypothetical protein
MANARYTQFFYTSHKKPVLLDCNFIVDQTNGNGLGIRSLKGQGISNVFMNTTASITGTVATTANQITSIAQGTSSLAIGMPVQGTGIPSGTTITSILSSSAVGISATPTGNHSSETITYQGVGNPNPASGHVIVQFNDCFNRYFGGFSGTVSPYGSSISSGLTVGNIYLITSLSSTTLAQWQAAGLPIGITPAVGAAFVAQATSVAGGGTVAPPQNAGTLAIEVIGDPNQTIISSSNSTSIIAGSSGAYLIAHFLGPKAVAFTATTDGSTGGLTAVSSLAGLRVGQSISGTGIPLGSTITAVGSSNTLTISANTTSANSGEAMTASGVGVIQPAQNSSVGMAFYFSSSAVMVDGE